MKMFILFSFDSFSSLDAVRFARWNCFLRRRFPHLHVVTFILLSFAGFAWLTFAHFTVQTQKFKWRIKINLKISILTTHPSILEIFMVFLFFTAIFFFFLFCVVYPFFNLTLWYFFVICIQSLAYSHSVIDITAFTGRFWSNRNCGFIFFVF